MKHLVFFCIAFILFSFVNRTGQGHTSPSARCSFNIMNGRLHGKYVSYYKNGNKKAEGKFENNYRSGKWSVWDEKGNLKVQRVYKNPFEYKQTFPEQGKGVSAPGYKLERDSSGCYKYLPIRSNKVVFSKRMWRLIEPRNNQVLFENDLLFNTIHKTVDSKQTMVYTNDSLLSAYNLSGFNASDYRITGFKVMEDYFFEKERKLGEYRVFAISPVAVNKNGDTIGLYWVKLGQDEPALRKAMAAQYINERGVPGMVLNLEDLFFFHQFHGTVYKEANEYNLELRALVKPEELEKEALQIELGVIDQEHDLWLTVND